MHSFSFIHRLADGSLRNVRVYSSPVSIGGKELLFSMVHDETAIVMAEKALQKRNFWVAVVVAVALLFQAFALVLLIRNGLRRKKVEKALRESEQKLSALFASMTEVVVLHELVFDDEGRAANYRITGCNAAFEKTLDIPKEKAVGFLATEVYGTTEAPYLAEYSNVALTGESLSFETYYTPLDKSFFINVVSPEKNTFATITADISQMKRAERLIEAKNKELEQVVYVASHDLRSPLVNVEGYSRELEYSLKDLIGGLNKDGLSTGEREIFLRGLIPDMTDALTRIRGSARQMDSLLAGLLKLSRSGRTALAIGPVDMNEVVGTVVSSLQFQIREAGALVTVKDLPPCKGDVVQLTQVFSNLLGNALKYLDPSRPGEIFVEGRIEGDRGVYEVKDNGIGIAKEHQERVFELFHRLNPSKGNGEGIGLTIVRQILWRLGGEVAVESQLGRGSLFRVTLPMTYDRRG